MKLAIVGGRDFDDEFLMAEHLATFMVAHEIKDDKYDIEVISGGARGADTLGERFAKIYGCEVTVFKPNWAKHGKSAGFIRNRLIVEECDMVLAFWDGSSKGTKHTIDIAARAKKPTFIVYY